MPHSTMTVRACPCCGLAQTLPPVPGGMRACCCRCGTSLIKRSIIARSRSRTAAVAAAALILYPFAITLPMLEVHELGHTSQSSILEGVAALFAAGEWIVAVIVLLCSIVIPLGKIAALFLLSFGMLQRRHRTITYHIVEWSGRWGMLDVLLVAILVAVVKLGDLVEVVPGPAALAFTCCVVLSLVATACFDPHSLWEPDR